MKLRPLILLTTLATLAALACGCANLEMAQQQQSDLERLTERVDRLEERLKGLQIEQEGQQRDIATLNKSLQDLTATAQARLQELAGRVATSDAAREADKKQIIDQLSRKIAELINSSQGGASARGGKAKTESGYEHVVKPGETLSQIAAAYKKTVSAIMKANNMNDAKSLRVGQKLFIPD